ncbi:Receptor-like protein kinase [Arachis hypogaea]|nr:Receptor-like protein kinase [Arachis hypogaea]
MSVVTLFLLILCFFALLLPSSSALVSDGITLLSLLSHWTFAPSIINFTWNPSHSIPCSWVGVQCNHEHNVLSLNLTDQGILSQFGPEIRLLHHLQTLVLANNGFSGMVPSELSNCSLFQLLDLLITALADRHYIASEVINLLYMSLSFNLLSGEIPDSLFQISQLQEVNLHSNHLSSPIPTSIDNLTELLRLDLHGNRLTGTISSSIGNCMKLEVLVLNENKLEGELPLVMVNLKHLKNISLFDNQLSGFIPQSLENNSSLVKLDLWCTKCDHQCAINMVRTIVISTLYHNFAQLTSKCTGSSK